MIKQQHPMKLQYPCLVYHAHIKYKVRVGKQCMPLSLRVLHAPPPKNQRNKNIRMGVLGLGLKLANYVSHWPKGIICPFKKNQNFINITLNGVIGLK